MPLLLSTETRANFENAADTLMTTLAGKTNAPGDAQSSGTSSSSSSRLGTAGVAFLLTTAAWGTVTVMNMSPEERERLARAASRIWYRLQSAIVQQLIKLAPKLGLVLPAPEDASPPEVDYFAPSQQEPALPALEGPGVPNGQGPGAGALASQLASLAADPAQWRGQPPPYPGQPQAHQYQQHPAAYQPPPMHGNPPQPPQYTQHGYSQLGFSQPGYAQQQQPGHEQHGVRQHAPAQPGAADFYRPTQGARMPQSQYYPMQQ